VLEVALDKALDEIEEDTITDDVMCQTRAGKWKQGPTLDYGYR